MKEARPKLPPLKIQGAKIIFKNFEGREQKFNREGDRNFAVILDEETADILKEDRWNVKQIVPNDPEKEPYWILKVKVNYDSEWPPEIYKTDGRQEVLLDEDTVGMLDELPVIAANLILSASWFEVNGKSGFTAYAKKVVALVDESEYKAMFDFGSVPQSPFKDVEDDMPW